MKGEPFMATQFNRTHTTPGKTLEPKPIQTRMLKWVVAHFVNEKLLVKFVNQ